MQLKQVSIGLFGTKGECRTVVLNLAEGKIAAGTAEDLDLVLNSILNRAVEDVAAPVEEAPAKSNGTPSPALHAFHVEDAAEKAAAIEKAAAAAKADEEARVAAKEAADALAAAGVDFDDGAELDAAAAADAELDDFLGDDA